MVHKIRKREEKVARKTTKRVGLHKLDFPKGRGYPTRIVVYVPNTKFEKPIPKKDFDKRVKSTVDFLSKTFGGTTRVSGTGTYYHKASGKVIPDKVVKVETFSPSKDYKAKDKLVEEFLNKKVKDWKQYSVSMEYESPTHRSSRMYFVESD
jgi:hypothetical protein